MNGQSGSGSSTLLQLSPSASAKICRFHRFLFQLAFSLPHPWFMRQIIIQNNLKRFGNFFTEVEKVHIRTARSSQRQYQVYLPNFRSMILEPSINRYSSFFCEDLAVPSQPRCRSHCILAILLSFLFVCIDAVA